jgi:hypothetical protein
VKKPSFVDFKRRLVVDDEVAIGRRFGDERELWTDTLHKRRLLVEAKLEVVRTTFTPAMTIEECERKLNAAKVVYEGVVDIPIYVDQLAETLIDPFCPSALREGKTHSALSTNPKKSAIQQTWELSDGDSPFFVLTSTVRDDYPKLSELYLSKQSVLDVQQLTMLLYATHDVEDTFRRNLNAFTNVLLSPLSAMLATREWNLQQFSLTPYRADYLLLYRFNPRRTLRLQIDLMTLRAHVKKCT